jgi:hypothetical protein
VRQLVQALWYVSDGRRPYGGQLLFAVRACDRSTMIRTFDTVCDSALSWAWEFRGLEFKADNLSIAGQNDFAGNSVLGVLDHMRVRRLPPFNVCSQYGSNLSVASVCGGWS